MKLTLWEGCGDRLLEETSNPQLLPHPILGAHGQFLGIGQLGIVTHLRGQIQFLRDLLILGNLDMIW